MPYSRKEFFDGVRKDLFRGTLTQAQVDGMNYELATWERHFEAANPRDGTRWLAYALATFFHETAERMQPIEEFGKGSGKSYGKPAGPHGQCYYGRGPVQLTWEDNYKKGRDVLNANYNIVCDIHKEPHRMLEDEVGTLVSYDGMVHGWFTGVSLQKYFNASVEDPINARRIVNGTDQAQKIANYYWLFKKHLHQVAKAETPNEVEAELPGLPAEPAMPDPSEVEDGEIKRRRPLRDHRDHNA
jgi:putative chitinase